MRKKKILSVAERGAGNNKETTSTVATATRRTKSLWGVQEPRMERSGVTLE